MGMPPMTGRSLGTSGGYLRGGLPRMYTQSAGPQGKQTMRTKHSGFTLIELMIVVAVIAILAAIAIPSYQEYIRKGRRSDAVSAMGRMQLAMERWRADNPSYANTAVPSASYPAVPTSPYYSFALSGQSATGYTVTATRQGAQANDTCGTLTYTFTGDLSAKPQWATASCN